MKLDEYISQVNIEEIYKTIVDLEGPKHPLENWDELEKAASYIVDKLTSYGIETEIQEFYLEDFEKPFKNIIGYIGDKSKPAILLGSHYDTVRGTPGANDNLSAVAVSLEVARILSKLENPPTVQIAVFTLEEGHPTKMKRIYEALQDKGWMDSQYRFTSSKMLSFSKKFALLVNKKHINRKTPIVNTMQLVLDEEKDKLQPDEIDYIETYLSVYKSFENLKQPKRLSNYLVGSSHYVEKIVEEKINIKNIIVYDCLGWIYNQEGTQKPLPLSDDLAPLLSQYKADIKSTTGNFIAVLGDIESKPFLDKFLSKCTEPNIDIPHIGFHIAFDFDTIFNAMPDMLRSDHAPFWEAGISGIFVSDTANFRSSFYHTGADKSNLLDYKMLVRIAIATLKTILE